MDAIILVGGFGTRLRPLTLSRPKQMLPVLDRPMIEHVVGHLGTQGITRAVLSLGYRPDAFEEAYPQGRCAGVELFYVVEPMPLDTAGAIAFAACKAKVQGTFVAVNGDVVHRFDLTALLDLHRQTAARATIALAPVPDPSRYGVVVCRSDGLVEAFVEKPSEDAVYSKQISVGIYVLELAALQSVPDGGRASIEREVFPLLVEQGAMYGLSQDEFWVDAGTPASYLDVQLALSEGGWAHPEAQIATDAVVIDSVVMQGAVVGAKARIVGSALLPGAHVGAGVMLDRSIVGYGAQIGARASLANLTVVGDAEVVHQGEVLVGQRRPAGDSTS